LKGSVFVRYWSVLFGAAAVLSVLAFLYAPFSPDWWLPVAGVPSHVISTFGREIDSLFIIILAITGIVFIGTQIVLVWAQYKFADELDAQGKPVRRAQYFHGSQRLEVIWTIIPSLSPSTRWARGRRSSSAAPLPAYRPWPRSPAASFNG
jgi:cytochrome c oxidase subunit II